jgi:ribosome-associated toxin RatA of RatAB toxin-antitoxin module
MLSGDWEISHRDENGCDVFLKIIFHFTFLSFIFALANLNTNVNISRGSRLEFRKL